MQSDARRRVAPARGRSARPGLGGSFDESWSENYGANGAPRGNIARAQAHWVSEDTIAWDIGGMGPVQPDWDVDLHYDADGGLELEAGGGTLVDATSLQIPGVLDDLYTYEGPLGVTSAGNVPNVPILRVWAPTARDVDLLVFDTAGAATPRGMASSTSTRSTSSFPRRARSRPTG